MISWFVIVIYEVKFISDKHKAKSDVIKRSLNTVTLTLTVPINIVKKKLYELFDDVFILVRTANYCCLKPFVKTMFII